MSTVLVSGGTGFIGRTLVAELLKKNYTVKVLTRDVSRYTNSPFLSYLDWNIDTGSIDPAAITGTDHIIHLAGAGIADKRWTTKRKKELQQSRVLGASLLLKALQEIPNQVQTVVCASAIGWYGPDPQIPNPMPFVENDPAYNDFLGNTCSAWESAISQVALIKKRLVILRTGIVLSPEGGALKEFLKPLNFAIAAILSKGTQVISWIHLHDLVRIYIHALENTDWAGIYNAVAPAPVSNKELNLTLARNLKGERFIPIHVPAYLLQILLGEMSIEVLKSTTVSCEKARLAGFQFKYPTIDRALQVPGN